jgi:hypothetical protein
MSNNHGAWEWQALLTELKLEYGGFLYGMPFSGQFFVFRALSRDEYSQLQQGGLDDEAGICRLAVVWPKDVDWEHISAGIPNQLAPYILDISGFGERQVAVGLLESYRQEMDDFGFQVQGVIAAAFPYLSLEEINSWPMDRQLYYLSRAEWILKTTRGIDVGIDLNVKPPEINPTEQVQQLRAEGIDPMMALYTPPRRDLDWVGRPLVMGVKRWRTGVVPEE